MLCEATAQFFKVVMISYLHVKKIKFELIERLAGTGLSNGDIVRISIQCRILDSLR